MRVALNQQKNVLPAACCRFMKSTAASDVSSSIVSMRFLVSGPVSSIVCLPTLPKRGSSVGSSIAVALQCSTPRGPNLARYAWILRVVGQLRLFLGIQVIEVAEEFVETVHRRERWIAITHMVLAELARGIAEILEQAADGRIQLAHAHRRAGESDLAQAAADDVLARQERRAARGAGLLTVVVLEL